MLKTTSPPRYARYPHPPLAYTSLEQRLYAALETLGLAYKRQVILGWYRVDALVVLDGGERIVLEADGCAPFHYCAVCGYDDPAIRARQAARDTALAALGLTVLHLPGHALRDERDALATVTRALAPYLTTREQETPE